MKEKYRKLVGKAIAIGCLVFFIVLLSLIKTDQNVSEYFFARGIARGYAFLMGNIASWFPFSLFDIFVTLGVFFLLLGLFYIFYYLKKKRKWKSVETLERMILAALSVVLVYVCVASGNYYRKEVPLPKYEGEQLSAEETAELVGVLLDDYASISASLPRREDGTTISPYTFRETADLIRKEYEKLDDRYFSSFIPSAKEGWYSKFLTSEGITGITFMPTGDAVVNKETPDCYKVVTTAHELAHTVGCMREGDANLMAYFVLLTSDVPYFRYCAYMYSLTNLTAVLYRLSPDLYWETIKKYPQEAYNERSLEDEFWESRMSFMDEVGDFLNDVYLKLSGSKDGTGSYHDYSGYSITVDDETKEVVEVKVHYSLTTRVLLKIAQDKKEKTK